MNIAELYHKVTVHCDSSSDLNRNTFHEAKVFSF